jgi:hypothetical protein
MLAIVEMRQRGLTKGMPWTGRAMEVLHVSGGERSSEIGMKQHVSLLRLRRLSRVLTPPGGGTRRRISSVGGVPVGVGIDERLRS